jgi:hypothetical protein
VHFEFASGDSWLIDIDELLMRVGRFRVMVRRPIATQITLDQNGLEKPSQLRYYSLTPRCINYSERSVTLDVTW